MAQQGQRLARPTVDPSRLEVIDPLLVGIASVRRLRYIKGPDRYMKLPSSWGYNRSPAQWTALEPARDLKRQSTT